MLSRILHILSAVTLISAFTACGKGEEKEAHKKPTIAVSISPLGNLVESICGDEYDIVTLLDRGANPETFDPAMSKRAIAEKCDIYFMLDAFPFEKSIAGKREGVVDVSAGIERLYGTHSHNEGEECHNEADPHTWTSAKNMKIIARNIGEAIMKYNPKDSKLYKCHLDSIISVIDSLDNELNIRLRNVHPNAFAIWNPSLGYFARD